MENSDYLEGQTYYAKLLTLSKLDEIIDDMEIHIQQSQINLKQATNIWQEDFYLDEYIFRKHLQISYFESKKVIGLLSESQVIKEILVKGDLIPTAVDTPTKLKNVLEMHAMNPHLHDDNLFLGFCFEKVNKESYILC